jgi:cell division septal protein FtsQ
MAKRLFLQTPMPPLSRREEYLKRKRRVRLIRFIVAFVLLVIVLSGLAFLSRRSFMTITQVELSGGVLITQDEMQKNVLEILQGSYGWLFPKRNAFVYPHTALVHQLKDRFKRIDTVEVSLKNLRTLSVVITERKPLALWCGENSGSAVACYFMDDNGTVFAESPLFSGDAYFKYYGPLAFSTDTIVGSQYLASSTDFSKLNTFVEHIRALDLRPEYLGFANVATTTQGEYVLALSSGGNIYFDWREPLDRTLENLKALLRTPALQAVPREKIEYIDLRFGNKVYYKLK